MTTDLILGTAGHIDHGKTSLVRLLTGVDTDRLPEEKARGITIDLGFAHLDLGAFRLGVVDVPGHERFVRNMLAGATGLDLAMLVVAADDSIKPQTREHFEILRLLRLPAGVIALTKRDLVDDDWLELVTQELRDFVAGTFLEHAPIVPVSSVTGQGVPELLAALGQAAQTAAAARRRDDDQTPFRMPLDRVFSLAGHGAVVTGSVASGRLAVGEEVEIQPGGTRLRVRGLQNHDQPVDAVRRGQRAAINLAGARHEELFRGQELAAPGYLRSSEWFTVELRLLPIAPWPLKHRARARLHLGAAEILVTVHLLGEERLAPGAAGLAQLRLETPAVGVWGQPFVLRAESPVVSIGGGSLLDPDAERLRHPTPETLALLSNLASVDPRARAAAAVYFRGLRPWRPSELARLAGVEQIDATVAALRAARALVDVPLSPTRTLCLHERLLAEMRAAARSKLAKMHAEAPLKLMLDRAPLEQAFAYWGEPALFEAVLRGLQDAQEIHVRGKQLALAGHGPKLSKNEQSVLLQLLEKFRAAGIESPSAAQCQQEATKHRDSIPQLLQLAAGSGELVEVASGYYLHAEVDGALQQRLRTAMTGGEGFTLSQLRELLGTTRKFAVPYCEHLDRLGFTRREGDLRYLANRAAAHDASATNAVESTDAGEPPSSDTTEKNTDSPRPRAP